MDTLVEIAIENIVKAAASGTIPSVSANEEAALREALLPRAMSDHTCESCKSNVPQFEQVGKFIASTLQWHLSQRRVERRVIVRGVQQTSFVEAPARATKWREVNVQLEWEVAKPLGTRRMICPSEFYVQHVLLISDKALEANLIPHFSIAMQGAVEALISREETLLSESRKNSVQAITVRKNLESKSVDVYALGRPEKGWMFESIIGMVEFF